MEYSDLSARQKQILEYIKYCIENNHIPPSVREIGEATGLSSPSSVHVHLKILEQKGYIKRQGAKSRSMNITPKACPEEEASAKSVPSEPEAYGLNRLPLVGDVAAGTPILAEQNIEEQISLPIALVGDQGSFLLRVKGDSMINAGILNGDVVIVKEQATADNGQIVVAMIDDGATVKTYYKEKDCIRLQPQNPALEPIFTRDAVIIGVVTGLFRSM